jgi:hypothetical protein
MTLYAQHGYGKGDKLESGLGAGSLQGVILSPRNESPERMAALANSLRLTFGSSRQILFDPQFYATTIPDANDGPLPDYPYYRNGLTRRQFISQEDIHRYALETLEYQAPLELDRLISPTVLFDDFRDPWSQIALSMAQESLAVHRNISGAPPLLLSLVVDENALRSRDALNEFLDIVTAWDVLGFYLIVRRNDRSYPAPFEETVLQNFLYLVYVLSTVNGYEVVCGYTDIVGMLMLAVGAKAIGTGWFNTLRQFSLSRFERATGGRPPRARYTSDALMSSILVVPELATASVLGFGADVVSGTGYDAAMLGDPSNAPWPPESACLHHWAVLARMATRFQEGSIGDRLDALEESVQRALALYAVLQRSGVQFDPPSGSRDLALWLRVIANFRLEAGL